MYLRTEVLGSMNSVKNCLKDSPAWCTCTLVPHRKLSRAAPASLVRSADHGCDSTSTVVLSTPDSPQIDLGGWSDDWMVLRAHQILQGRPGVGHQHRQARPDEEIVLVKIEWSGCCLELRLGSQALNVWGYCFHSGWVKKTQRLE